MKTIYIVRHAKAILRSSEINDIERPLLKKGETNTKFVTDYLLTNNISVSLIITSHALRALETAKIFAAAFKYPEENIITDSQLYYSGADAIFNELYDISDNINSVMIIGHNPSVTSFANYFIEDKIDNLPTSGVIGINFETEKWQNISKSKSEEIFRVFPRILRKAIKHGALAI